MPRCYMVKKSRTHHDCSSPCSPTEASVAPPCYNPDEHSAYTESHKPEYAELASLRLSERSEADTEAAHELLSLSQSLPPPPPAAPSLLPVYTYTIQPTNIYIVTENLPEPIYQTFQAVAPCPCDNPTEPHIGYITYQTVPPQSVPPQGKTTDSVTETDSDPEPQLVIASDVEQETEIVQDSEPDHTFEELEVEFETKQLPYSELSPRLSDGSGSEPKPNYYKESPTRSVHYDESASPHYSELKTMPLLYTESSPTVLDNSDTEHRPTHYATPYSPPPLQPKPEYLKKDEPEVTLLPCEIALESQPAIMRRQKKKYDCKDCGKRYATVSNLSRHKQTHRSLDSMMAKRCGECGKVYVSMPALAMHVLTHRMGHVCGVCGKQFSRPWLLRGHVRSHTGEKPYSCGSCGKAFADRSNLRAHLQTHTSAKKYVCQHCNKTFALKSYLNKHQDTACARPVDE